MKNLLFAFTALLAIGLLSGCVSDDESVGFNNEQVEIRAPGNGNTVPVCHYDEDKCAYRTIYVNKNALQGHLGHGDYEGECVGCCFDTWIGNYGSDDILSWSIGEDETWIRFKDGSFAVVALFSHRGCAGPAPWCGGCSPTVGSSCTCNSVDQDGNPVEGPIANMDQAMACRQILICLIEGIGEAPGDAPETKTLTNREGEFYN